MMFSDLAILKWISKNKPQEDILIIIPSFGDYPALFCHLQHLKRQTYAKFDVLILLGFQDTEKELIVHIDGMHLPFSVLVAKRKEDTGAAGGLFAGQLFALERNYQYVITAERDCMPIDSTIVEKLYERRSSGYVAGKLRRIEGDKEILKTQCGVEHYTLFSSSLLRKYGFFYAPLYLGGEDAEYEERIKEKKERIDCYCTHPLEGSHVPKRIERHLLYVLNGVLMEKRPTRFLHQFFKLMLASYSSLFFLRKEYSRNFWKILSALFHFRLGLYFLASMRPLGFEKIHPISDVTPAEISFERIQTPPKYFFGLLLRGLQFLRAEISIKRTYELSPVFTMPIFAKRVYANLTDTQYLLLSEQKNAAVHFTKTLAFFMTFPIFFLVILALFLPLKILCSPNTLKYGVRGLT